MPGVNFITYGWSSARTTQDVSLSWSLILGKNIVAVIAQNRVIDDNFLDDKLKTKICILVDYCY